MTPGSPTSPERVPDRARYREKVLMGLLASPWTLVPFLAGVTTLLAAWTFNIDSGAVVFAGLASMLGAVGIFFSRLFLQGESLGEKVLDGMRREAQAKREESLDHLDRRLSADQDSRTEGSLRDLRALAKAFNESETWSSAFQTRSNFDIMNGVEQLFDRCVLLLEKTLTLWYTARDMATKEAREPILKQRDRIIEDVGKGIKQLGRILAEIQSLGTGEDSEDAHLSRIRDELDQSLEVAKQVEQRMQRLDRELESGISSRIEPWNN